MKFVLLVEGATEKYAVADFLKRWLDPQLQLRVGISVVQYQGYAQLARKIVDKAQMHLDGPKQADIIAVIGLLDLYGPDFYPANLTTAQDRNDWGIKYFQEKVNRDRFRMFFAIHEFEAWLLSDPEIFPDAVARALPKKAARPEDVDFDQHPAALLDSIYKKTLKLGYKKTTYGKNLFGKLDPIIAVEKCPHLKEMLQEMLVLAKGAGL